MAQGFDVTQSLFGNVLTPEQQATSAAMQQAQLGGLGGAEFQAFRAQESARQQIPKIFGQQSEEDIVKDVRNKNLPILQSQGKVAYLDAIIADFAARGLGNKAFLAQQLKDQVADAEQKRMADLAYKTAQTAESLAKADKAGREGRKPLADRLVELDTKQATEGLTAAELAEKNALERVVKIQAPKGVDLSGIAAVMGKKADEAEGKAIGEARANITGKQQAIDSITAAEGYLTKGIYSGEYAEIQKRIAKGTLGAVGDKNRVINTESFLAEINNTVIPMLKEFGGNDSNEELRFLQRVVGGDITLEEQSIKNILKSAKTKINRGIERLKAQNTALREGKEPMEAVTGRKTVTKKTKSGVEYTVEE